MKHKKSIIPRDIRGKLKKGAPLKKQNLDIINMSRKDLNMRISEFLDNPKNEIIYIESKISKNPHGNVGQDPLKLGFRPF